MAFGGGGGGFNFGVPAQGGFGAPAVGGFGGAQPQGQQLQNAVQGQGPNGEKIIMVPSRDSHSDLTWRTVDGVESLLVTDWAGALHVVPFEGLVEGGRGMVDTIRTEGWGPALSCIETQASGGNGTCVVGFGDGRVCAVDFVGKSFREGLVAKHDDAVQWMRAPPSGPVSLWTGGHDNRICGWDFRASDVVPVTELVIGHVKEGLEPPILRCFDVDMEKMIVGHTPCGDQGTDIDIYDLRGGRWVHRWGEKSPLKRQIVSVAISPRKEGYAAGSIEGRCTVGWFNRDIHDRQKFTFKCHRHQPKVYSCSHLAFTEEGAMLTAGSDGTYTAWDVDARSRLCKYKPLGGPIAATAISRKGRYALSVSSDFSQGDANWEAWDLPGGKWVNGPPPEYILVNNLDGPNRLQRRGKHGNRELF